MLRDHILTTLANMQKRKDLAEPKWAPHNFDTAEVAAEANCSPAVARKYLVEASDTEHYHMSEGHGRGHVAFCYWCDWEKLDTV